MTLTAYLALAGDNRAEAIKVALVAGDDGLPDLGEYIDVLKRPIHGHLCPVAHSFERYRAWYFGPLR